MNDSSANHLQKAYAKMLYTKHDNTIEDIALEIETDEATIRNWIRESHWDGIKRSLLTSRTAQIQRYYKVIEHLDGKLKNDDEITVKHADLIAKYTACIKNLKEETTVTEILDVTEQFITWLRRQDAELSKIVVVELDNFVKERLSPPIA